METKAQPQTTLDKLIPPPEASLPNTPQPAHATMPATVQAAIGELQSSRVENASGNATPPPSSQLASDSRTKTRTPTPTFSHISTPPPTVGEPTQSQAKRSSVPFSAAMTPDQIASLTSEELRTKVTTLQSAYQETKMTAAHHKLQYQMLSQESSAAIERLAVEARMAQYENDVIHIAEQAKTAAIPVAVAHSQEGIIPVQKDLYQSMCREIQQLTEANAILASGKRQQEKTILRLESEVATLTDRVDLMRDRITQNREMLSRYRRPSLSTHVESTPRSVYSTPNRAPMRNQEPAQNFAALLQASEMASQEAKAGRTTAGRGTGGKRGHSKNSLSMSNIPSTPSRIQKPVSAYQTPQGRQPELKIPATAPVFRHSGMHALDVYHPPSMSTTTVRSVPAPLSEGTVSVSDHERGPGHSGEDSEAETEILSPEPGDEIGESQASRAAGHMLRTSQEYPPIQGGGRSNQPGPGMKQTKLFGAVRKSNIGRAGDDEPPAKRARVAEGVGLGIAGVRP